MKTNTATKSLFSFMLSVTTVIFTFLAAPPAAAEETGKCRVNDLEFSQGDTITYTLKIDEAGEKFSGIDISVYYDPECLSLNSDKISLPVFRNAVFSEDLNGEIRFNAIDVVDGFDFTNGGTVISAAFQIKNEAKESTDITFSIRELYDLDSEIPESVTDYKTSVTIVKGEEKDGSIVKPKNIDEIEKELETQYGVEPEEEKGTDYTVLILCCCAVAVVAAAGIIAVILFRNRKNKS